MCMADRESIRGGASVRSTECRCPNLGSCARHLPTCACQGGSSGSSRPVGSGLPVEHAVLHTLDALEFMEERRPPAASKCLYQNKHVLHEHVRPSEGSVSCVCARKHGLSPTSASCAGTPEHTQGKRDPWGGRGLYGCVCDTSQQLGSSGGHAGGGRQADTGSGTTGDTNTRGACSRLCRSRHRSLSVVRIGPHVALMLKAVSSCPPLERPQTPGTDGPSQSSHYPARAS